MDPQEPPFLRPTPRSRHPTDPAHGGSLKEGELVTYNQLVVGSYSEEDLDRVFHALADATRRDILRRSIESDRSVSRLADAYPMSFAAVQKHVAVLERAGLIVKEPRGREQLVHTDPEAIRGAHRALDRLEDAWRARVDGMSQLLAEEPQPRAGGRDR